MNALWMDVLWMDAPQRGNKHIARGREQRHPGCHVQLSYSPCKGKSINYQTITFFSYPHVFLCFCPCRAR